MIKLSDNDKITNFCDSCTNIINNDNGVLCRLTDKKPDFEKNCSDYKLDNTIDIAGARLSLFYDFHLNNGGNIYPNQYFNLIENVDINCSKNFRANTKITFNSYSIFKVENVLIILVIVGWAAYNTLFRDINEFRNVWFYIFIIVIGMFIYIRGVFRHNKLIIDINGIQFNKSIYLWNSIADIYLKRVDNGSESDGEEYIIIILNSGKRVKLDTQHLDFLGVKRLKKILNFYRQESKIRT